MTTDDKKKLLSALKVLREECNKHEKETCYECPLCTDYGCNLHTPPKNWHLSNEKKDIWRAFT